MTDRCPCGLHPEFAAPEAHDDPRCEHRRPPMPLRLVHDDERDAEVPSLVQVADMPGAYAVRRVDRLNDRPVVMGPAAEAIINRGNTGDWHVMFGHDPDSQQWLASATLPGRLNDAEAGAASIELVDAYALGVPDWPGLLARAMMAGEPLLALARLHTPLCSRQDDPRFALCRAEAARYEPSVVSWPVVAPPFWRGCETVKILAASFGMHLSQ